MVFLFIRLHGIERLVSTALEQGFFFFEKTTSFPCLVGSELNYIFQLKAQSRIFTRSLLRLDTDIFFLIRKKWAKNMVRWYFLFFQSQKIVTYFYHLITQIVMCVRHARAPLFDLLQNKLLAERNSVEGFICQLRYIIVRTPPPPSPPALF